MLLFGFLGLIYHLKSLFKVLVHIGFYIVLAYLRIAINLMIKKCSVALKGLHVYETVFNAVIGSGIQRVTLTFGTETELDCIFHHLITRYAFLFDYLAALCRLEDD